MGIESRNPATEELVERFDPLSDVEIESALDRASRAFQVSRHTPVATRSKWLTAAAEVLDEDAEYWAEILTTEMGKTFAAAVAEVPAAVADVAAWAARLSVTEFEAIVVQVVVIETLLLSHASRD